MPQSLQPSAWTLENELAQLQMFGFITPLIFLGVAAFILNVALARALTLQRAQIAALKALGFSNRELAWHYIKWALVIAAVGAAAGVLLGAWLGAGMMELYNNYFRFPIREVPRVGRRGCGVAGWQPARGGARRAIGGQAGRAGAAGRGHAS